MKRFLAAALMLLASCSGAVSASGWPPAGTGGPEHQEDQELWAQLLECSLVQTRECRTLLKGVAEESCSAPHQELASILLEKWHLDANDPVLGRARRVWVLLPTLEELQRLVPGEVKPATLVISGIVRPDGRIEDLQLLRRSQYEDVNQAILDAFAKGKYRPARDGRRFVSQRVEFLYRLHPG